VPCQETLQSAPMPQVSQGGCRVSPGQAPPAVPYLQACRVGEVSAGVPPAPGPALASAAFATGPEAGPSVMVCLSCPQCPHCCVCARVTPVPAPSSRRVAPRPPLPPPQCDMPPARTPGPARQHLPGAALQTLVGGSLTHNPALSTVITSISPSNQTP